VKETSDSELKAVMQSGSDYANQQIKDKQAKMRDFINQTKQDRDYFKEQNYGRIAYPKNFGKTPQNSLTSARNSGKLKEVTRNDFVGLSSDLRDKSLQINYILNYYVNIKSKWSGKTNIKLIENLAGALGAKEWNCNITLREDADTKVIIHEHLHARSGSYYSVKDYIKYKKIEEGTVEYFAQQICKINGIEYSGVYKQWVKPIRQINSIIQINKDEYLFAKELFEVAMPKRYEWLKNKAREYLNKNPDISDKKKYKLKFALDNIKPIK